MRFIRSSNRKGISRETDCGIYMHAGPEIGVASTKAFTSQVVILSLLGNLIGQSKGIPDSTQIVSEMKNIPLAIENLLKISDQIYRIAKTFSK